MEALGINAKLLIAQIINFSIFFFVFKKFISQPFLHYLNEQHKDEKKRQDLTKELEQGQTNLNLEKEKILKAARKEATEIIAQAKKSADEVKSQIIADANKQAEVIKVKGMNQVEEAKNKINLEVKDKIVSTSGLMLDSVLGEFINAEMQDKIVQELLKKVSSSKYEN